MAEPRYNLLSEGRKYGPYDLRQLARMLDDGEIGMESWCIRVGDGEMQQIQELLEWVGDEAPKASADDRESAEDDDEAELESLFEEVPFGEGIWVADEEDDDDVPVSTAQASASDEPDPDEIICRLHPSLFGYPKLLFLIILFGSAAAFLIVIGPYIGVPLGQAKSSAIGLALLLSLWLIILRHFDNYLITRTRAEVVRGIIAKSSNEVRISDIRRIDVDKPGLLGLLNVGDVKLSSAGTGGFDIIFAKVRAGHKVKKILRRVQKDPMAPRRRLLHGKGWLRR